MTPDTTIIVDMNGGVERRLAFGVTGDEGQAYFLSGDQPKVALGDGDLRFLKRALAALDLPPLRPEFIPPFDLDDPNERPAHTPSAPPVVADASAPAVKAGQRWTDEEDAALDAQYRAGQSPSQIAAKLGRSEIAIISRLLSRGLAVLRPANGETP